MSNWLTDFQGDNSSENKIIVLLNELIVDFPEEKKTLEGIISSLRREPLSDDLLFEIREKLRRIISKDEHNLIRKKNKISEKIKKISSFKIENESEFYDFEDCFFDGYDFKIGEDFYYLRLPGLHSKVDFNANSELMIDRSIKDFIKSSLLDYQLNRENFEQFEEFSLIIIHHLTPEKAALIDTDNIEIKKPIDAINKVLIKNDTANYSDIFQIVQISDEEYTEMYVIKGHALGRSILGLLEGLK